MSALGPCLTLDLVSFSPAITQEAPDGKITLLGITIGGEPTEQHISSGTLRVPPQFHGGCKPVCGGWAGSCAADWRLWSSGRGTCVTHGCDACWNEGTPDGLMSHLVRWDSTKCMVRSGRRGENRLKK